MLRAPSTLGTSVSVFPSLSGIETYIPHRVSRTASASDDNERSHHRVLRPGRRPLPQPSVLGVISLEPDVDNTDVDDIDLRSERTIDFLIRDKAEKIRTLVQDEWERLKNGCSDLVPDLKLLPDNDRSMALSEWLRQLRMEIKTPDIDPVTHQQNLNRLLRLVARMIPHVPYDLIPRWHWEDVTAWTLMAMRAPDASFVVSGLISFRAIKLHGEPDVLDEAILLYEAFDRLIFSKNDEVRSRAVGVMLDIAENIYLPILHPLRDTLGKIRNITLAGFEGLVSGKNLDLSNSSIYLSVLPLLIKEGYFDEVQSQRLAGTIINALKTPNVSLVKQLVPIAVALITSGKLTPVQVKAIKGVVQSLLQTRPPLSRTLALFEDLTRLGWL